MGTDSEARSYTEPRIRAKNKKGDPKNVITVLENNPNGVFLPTGANTVSLIGCIQYQFGDAVQLRRGSTDVPNLVCYKQMRFNSLCNLVCTANAYIGAELFTNQLCGNNGINQAALTNPALLVGDTVGWRLKTAQGPRMYIVAGGQYIIGNRPLYNGSVMAAASAPAVGPSGTTVVRNVIHSRGEPGFGNEIKVINKGEGNLGAGLRFDPPFLGSKKKNAPSICCIIICRIGDTKPDTPPQQSFRILHFLGGDSLFDQEGGIASWISNGFTAGQPNWRTTESLAMKLSQ